MKHRALLQGQCDVEARRFASSLGDRFTDLRAPSLAAATVFVINRGQRGSSIIIESAMMPAISVPCIASCFV
jgi:hypothetical protein